VVSLDFSVTYFFRPYLGPGVDLTPTENEYQDYFLGVKAAGEWGWRPHHLNVPNIIEFWEPKPPGTLWVTPGLLREFFTFYSQNESAGEKRALGVKIAISSRFASSWEKW